MWPEHAILPHEPDPPNDEVIIPRADRQSRGERPVRVGSAGCEPRFTIFDRELRIDDWCRGGIDHANANDSDALLRVEPGCERG